MHVGINLDWLYPLNCELFISHYNVIKLLCRAWIIHKVHWQEDFYWLILTDYILENFIEIIVSLKQSQSYEEVVYLNNQQNVEGSFKDNQFHFDLKVLSFSPLGSGTE